jgi:hypothetical protein
MIESIGVTANSLDPHHHGETEVYSEFKLDVLPD